MMISSFRFQMILAILMAVVTKTTGFIAIPGPTSSRFGSSKASPPSLYINEEEPFGLPILANRTDSVRRNITSTTAQRVTTLIFDVDDTLYDISCGFKKHRNGEIIQKFMVDRYNFPSLEAAKEVRDSYFARFHATAKGLTVAQQEGMFPPGSPLFDTKDLSEYWAENLNYDLLVPPNKQLLKKLSNCPCTLVAFSNSPRKYVKRVLHQLGLFEIFGEERLYAVDDVLPFCKPEIAAFEKVFDNIGNPSPESCVMVEDSIRNIRQAKQIGMKTVLITGKSEEGRIIDKPEVNDPAVDISMETIDDFFDVLPGLLESEPVFDPRK